MRRRQLAYLALFSALLAIVCFFFVDKSVAAFVNSVGGSASPVLRIGTTLLEFLSGFPLAKYFLSFVLFSAAFLLFLWPRRRALAWLVLFVASANLMTRIVAGLLKAPIGRLRPFEVIANGTWDPRVFFAHGSSFPSGHVAHFWGLFLPLLFLFPRYRIVLLIIPLFIAVARVGVNDHWCSDVLGSISLAALFTLVCASLFRIDRRSSNAAPVVSLAEN